MIMSFEGYQEALESQKAKEDQLKTMSEQFNTIQSQMQTLLTAVANIKDQNRVNEFSKTLFDSGILKTQQE